MLRRCNEFATLAFVLFLFATSDAAATAQRTFVSTVGVNNPTCSLAAPCRDFATAITATSPDGEVIVLDSGGYGPVTITQSVSIIAPQGVYAGISVFAGNDGVTVSAGATDKVLLRGLTINGQGGNHGIVISSGGQVHIEQCNVTNMGGNGIQISGGARIHIRSSVVRSNAWYGLIVLAAAGTPKVHVLDSQFARNGLEGIHVAAGTLDAKRITADDNDQGVFVGNNPAGTSVVVTITDSVLSGNVGNGAQVQTAPYAGSIARMAVVRTTSARNGGSGFVANASGAGTDTVFFLLSDSAAVENGGLGLQTNGAGATAIVTGSTLAGNYDNDLRQMSSAVLRSSGNNTLTGRFSGDISGTLTFNPLK